MADKHNKELIQVIEANSADWLEQVPAVLGDLEGNVDAGGSRVYARLDNGYVIVALNYVAPLIFDLHVLVGRNKAQPGYFQVISVRETYVNPASDFVKYHHEQHEYPNADTVWVDRKQLMPLTILVSNAAGFVVRVFGDVALTANGIQVIDNQDVDLSSYVPATGAKYVSVEVDDDGVISVNDGTAVGSPELLTEADIPAPAVGKYFLGYVMLYEAQAELSNDDVRVAFPLNGNPGSYQPFDEDLTAIAALTPAEGDLLQYVSGTWTNVTINDVVTTRWEPLTNGDPSDPQLVFDGEGNVIMTEVEI